MPGQAVAKSRGSRRNPHPWAFKTASLRVHHWSKQPQPLVRRNVFQLTQLDLIQTGQGESLQVDLSLAVFKVNAHGVPRGNRHQDGAPTVSQVELDAAFLV